MKRYLLILALLCSWHMVTAQNVRVQNQVWTGIISQVKWNKKWSLLGDIIIRRNEFLDHPSFSFIRVGLARHINDHSFIAAGFGHMWLEPTVAGWNTKSNEHRFYQQYQLSYKWKTIGFVHRWRNEQRWQEKVINDQHSHQFRFTNRIRYMAGLTLPVSKNRKFPSISVSDELMFHFGKEVIYNHFDQNRLFLGIKQTISKTLSIDLGYMRIWQKKYSIGQFDLDHCLRLFVYYNPPLKNKLPAGNK